MVDDDKKLPAEFKRLPQSVGGELLPYISAKKRTEIIDNVFDAIGGEDALADWSRLNNDNRKTFYGWWVKGAFKGALPAPQDGDGRAEKVEELLARLDAGESAIVISNPPTAYNDESEDE